MMLLPSVKQRKLDMNREGSARNLKSSRAKRSRFL